MSCIKIRFKNVYAHIPVSLLDNDGYVYLDVRPDFDMSAYKVLAELTDIEQLTFNYTVTDSLPVTDKNDFLLQDYLHGRNDHEPVEVFVGSVWEQYLFRVISATKSSYEIELVTYDFYWAAKLNSKKLNEIDLGYIPENEAYRGLSAGTTPIPKAYDPSDPDSTPYCYPLIDYGDLRTRTDFRYNPNVFLYNHSTSDPQKIRTCFPIGFWRDKVGWEKAAKDLDDLIIPTINEVDLRPCFFVYAIVRRIFGDIGYEVVSPILQSSYGRRLIAYLLDPKLAEEELLPERILTFEELAGYTGTYPIGGKIVPYTYTKNGVIQWKYNMLNLKSADTISGNDIIMNFSGFGIYNLDITIAWTTKEVEKKANIRFHVYLMEGDNIVHNLGFEVVEEVKKNTFNTTEISISDVAIKRGQYVAVFAQSNGYKVHYIHDLIIPPPPEPVSTDDDVDYKLINGNCARVLTIEDYKTQLKATQTKRFFWLDQFYGDTKISEILNREITQLEFLKGVCHLLNLKIYTDYTHKKLYLLQPDDINLFGTSLQGFYDTQITLDYIKDSYKTTPQKDDVKQVKLMFKGTDLHHSIIPISENGDEKVFENPLFTVFPLHEYGRGSGELSDIPTEPVDGLSDKWYIPVAAKELEKLESEDAYFRIILGGKWAGRYYSRKITRPLPISFDIDPAIMLNYGYKQQPTEGLAIGNFRTFNFAGTYFPRLSVADNPSHDIQYAFQYPSETLYFEFDQPLKTKLGIKSGLGALMPDQNLTELHRNWILNQHNQPTLEYLVHDTITSFNYKSLREVIKLQHLGKPVNTIIKQITDFKYCNTLPVLYSLQPYFKQVHPNCIDELVTEWRGRPPLDYDCETLNAPNLSLAAERQDEFILISIVGLNTDPIVGVVFEVSYDNGDTWSVVPNLTPISAQIWYDDVTILIRAEIEYLNCPLTLTQVVVFDPCTLFLDEPLIEAFRVYENGAAKIWANIITELDYTIVRFQYLDSEGEWQDYNDGEELFTNDTIFEIELEIDNGCNNLTQTVSIGGTVQCPDTDDIDILYENFTFVKVGEIPFDYIEDKIFYQISDDGEEWQWEWVEWDNYSNVVANFIRARRIIKFCGDCPDICTAIKYFTASECLENFTIKCLDWELSIVEDIHLCSVEWFYGGSSLGVSASIIIENEGIYTAIITCGTCVYNATFNFQKPNTGSPIGNPIVIQ